MAEALRLAKQISWCINAILLFGDILVAHQELG